ncbi:MAG TPA: polysaccharide deacetylase family protein [Tenuifilaceae bacterium]|jgi:peptidoglycan/xylan/chitin deacetylase (PgdA/CDA1 family)|nr:polysaccharide deacetylase family protein [Tenuifilaceae bacterium]HPX05636.1 polysaccharide deacetylase family protein [Tenuifilaceae bacterium]
MINLSPPRLIARFFRRQTWYIPNETNGIYLTFDDGPNSKVTPWVLEQLRKFEAKATFFCLGKNAEMNPEVFEMVKAEGHAIGNHTYSHIKGWEVETGQYVQDVDFANDILQSKLFRPPYGRIKPSQLKILSERYKIIMWDVLSMDYSRNISRRRCFNMVKKNLRPGSIIVFHDSVKAEKNLRYALPRVLEWAKSQGYEFKVLS